MDLKEAFQKFASGRAAAFQPFGFLPGAHQELMVPQRARSLPQSPGHVALPRPFPTLFRLTLSLSVQEHEEATGCPVPHTEREPPAGQGDAWLRRPCHDRHLRRRRRRRSSRKGLPQRLHAR